MLDKMPLALAAAVTVSCLVLGVAVGWVAHTTLTRQPDWRSLFIQSLQLPVSPYEAEPHLEAIEQKLASRESQMDSQGTDELRDAIASRRKKLAEASEAWKSLEEIRAERTQLQRKNDSLAKELDKSQARLENAKRDQSNLQALCDRLIGTAKECESRSRELAATTDAARRRDTCLDQLASQLVSVTSRPAAISVLAAAVRDCDDRQLRQVVGLLESLLRDEPAIAPGETPTGANR